MGNFNKLFNKPLQVNQIFIEIADLGLIDWKLLPNEQLEYGINPIHPKASPITNTVLAEIACSGDRTQAAEAFVAGQILQSPKIFSPSQLNCEAMEQIAINLTLQEYHQPFPTMVIELPEDYSKNRIVPCEQAGDEFYGQILAATHSPLCISLHFNEELKLLISSVYFSSGQVINRLCWWTHSNFTIEEHLDVKLNENNPASKINADENRVSINLMRLGMNACLMLMEYGCKSKGYANPSYAERLRRYINKAEKKGDKDKANKEKTELRQLPIYYDFEQIVTLYDSTNTVSSDSVKTGSTHATPVAHWRKGHWVNQPYGPKQSLRKCILRKPVFVNAHLLQQGRIITQYKQK